MSSIYKHRHSTRTHDNYDSRQRAIAKAEVARGAAIDGETFVEGILDKFRQTKVAQEQ